MEEIPSDLKEVIIGLALGDLYIRKRAKNTSLQFKQSVKHEDYILHLYTLFRLIPAPQGLEGAEYCKMTPKIKDAIIKNKTHQSIFFDTLTYEAFNYFFDLFYQKGKKVVPHNIVELLTYRSLAYWAPSLLLIFFFAYLFYSLGLQELLVFGTADSLCYLSGLPFLINGVNVTPVKSYLNADKDKKLIYDENKNKIGVYCWINLTNNRCYIGSSSNLSKRFSWYYSIENLNKRFDNSLICRSLLKYGYSGFRLDILEYCAVNQLLEREQYYIDAIKPKYNILLIAGSSLGYKHSEETLAKLKGRELSLEHLTKLKEHLTKHNASEDQRTKAKARMLIMNKQKGITVSVLDTVTGVTKIYNSIREAASLIGCAHITILRAEKFFLAKGTNKLVNERYIVKINR